MFCLPLYVLGVERLGHVFQDPSDVGGGSRQIVLQA